MSQARVLTKQEELDIARFSGHLAYEYKVTSSDRYSASEEMATAWLEGWKRARDKDMKNRRELLMFQPS